MAITQGQRPDAVTRYGQFFGVTFFDGPLTPYSVLVLQKDDGSEVEIFALLQAAIEAWERELVRLGL